MRSSTVPWSMTSTCISLKMSAKSFTLSATWLICLSRSADIWSIITSWSVCCAEKRGSTHSLGSSSKKEEAPADGARLLSERSGRYSSMVCPLSFATYVLCPFLNSVSSSCSCFATLRWMFSRTSSSPWLVSPRCVPIVLSFICASLNRLDTSATVCVICVSVSSSSSPNPGSSAFPDMVCSSDSLIRMEEMSLFKSLTSVTHLGGTVYTLASIVLPSSSLGAASRFLCTLKSFSSREERGPRLCVRRLSRIFM
mmetsp:Transcript_16342/g.39167  ORF Transcript_16342/g.39167 Transcript_16342/m.39167 type:complete len:254 (-) Transcript_16342:307-1068(-)